MVGAGHVKAFIEQQLQTKVRGHENDRGVALSDDNEQCEMWLG